MSQLINSIKKNYLNSKDKNLYKDNFDRKDLISINKAIEMLNKRNLANLNKDTKILDIKYTIFENKYIIFT